MQTRPARAPSIRFLLLLCAPLLAPALAVPAGRSDTAQDYSHSLPLTVSGKNAVVQLRLPKSVYLNARTEDLRDLRVFDAHGAALPFTVLAPPVRKETRHRVLATRIFPLFDAVAGASGAARLDIRMAPDGSLLSVTTRRDAAAANRARPALTALIIDLRQGGAGAAPLDALRFTLPAGTRQYAARVRLESSDDLKQWNTIGYSEIGWLTNHATDALVNDRITFPAQALRYARIIWQDGAPIEFAAIDAESPEQTELAPALDSHTLAPSAGKFPNDVQYQSALAIPVERMGLQFSEQNIVMPALLGTYVEVARRHGRDPSSWEFRRLLRATFFQIMQEGKPRRGGDIAVDRVHQGQWVLRPLMPTASKPTLQLMWTPATLVFMANGYGPYSLCFGRDQAEPARLDVTQVAPGFSDAELLALEQAVPGALQERGRPGAMAAAPGAGARTRMAMLWGVLLLGVGVLGFMAWRLIRLMGEQT